MQKLRLKRHECARFYWYLLNSIVSRAQFNYYQSATIGLGNLSAHTIGELAFPHPSYDAQVSIVDFLDKSIGNIDEKANLLLQQIDVLERYKKSLIHEAVTKGPDPDIPMKDSGIEWIGKIPKHWEAKKLKYLATFSSGATPSKDNLDFWKGEIPWVSSLEVKEDVLFDTSLHITPEAIGSCSTSLMPEGTLVMVVRSGILQHTLPVALLGKPMTTNQDIKSLSFGDEVLPKYFLYFVKGNNENLLKVLMKDKSTVDNISQHYLESLLTLLPPKEEQKLIIEYLDERCTKIDAILDIKRKQVDVLKRRRQSLIYEYVTGKRRAGEEV